jgi:hypothetical protein
MIWQNEDWLLTLNMEGKTMHKDIEVNLLEEREDGYHAYCVIFSDHAVDDLTRLMEFRMRSSLEETIEDALSVELEMAH